MRWRIRAATTDEGDVGFLREMLYEAALWRAAEHERPPLAAHFSKPEAARYVDGWGRDGDYAVIAEAEEPVGAASYRLFPEEEPGYGFVSPSVPEVAIGVVAPARGQGIGGSLMGALIEQARRAGYPALSLSVEEDNRARRLYERLGFVRVGGAGNAWTMRLEL